MMKVIVQYPTKEEELEIINRMARTSPPNDVECVMQSDSISHARKLVDQIYLDDQIARYIVDLVQATRTPGTVSDELAEFVDRKSTRLNSSHVVISYAVFCLKKKTPHPPPPTPHPDITIHVVM
mgnify:CR=1 FL=1